MAARETAPLLAWGGRKEASSGATLAGGAGASVAVLVDSDWLAFWGNPCIPAVLTSLVASVVVTLLTPASSMSREQALEMITRERESRPTPPPLPIGKRHTSRG